MTALQMTFPKVAESLSAIFDFLTQSSQELQLDADLTQTLHLAVEEVFMNFVRYNTESKNDVDIIMSRGTGQLRITLVDHDVHSYDPTKRPPVDITAPPHTRQPGGLGIHLIREMMDDVIYEYADRTCRITLVKRLGDENASDRSDR